MKRNASTIRFTSFPPTEPPPGFSEKIISVFLAHERQIATKMLKKGLTSNQALAVIASDLRAIGFEVESGKRKSEKIHRPVFFGEDGVPTLRYEIDAYHSGWKCALEIEAGRAWMGNAVYRDLIQALVMVDIDYLCLAVPNSYVYQTGGRQLRSGDYENALAVARALYGHSRLRFPYRLILIGY